MSNTDGVRERERERMLVRWRCCCYRSTTITTTTTATIMGVVRTTYIHASPSYTSTSTYYNDYVTGPIDKPWLPLIPTNTHTHSEILVPPSDSRCTYLLYLFVNGSSVLVLVFALVIVVVVVSSGNSVRVLIFVLVIVLVGASNGRS